MATWKPAYTAAFLDGVISSRTINTTPSNSDVQDLRSFFGTLCKIEIDFPATPVNDVRVDVYHGVDAGNIDDRPSRSFLITAGADAELTIEITGTACCRVALTSTGATDTQTANVRWQPFVVTDV